MNRVILLGRLGRDPETRYASEGGTAICRLALATSRRYRDRDGNRKEDTEWHNVSLFGKTAELAQQYLHKGDEVYIEGRLRTRKYTGRDGIERYATEVICESMQFGARANAASGSGSSGNWGEDSGFESDARTRGPESQPFANQDAASQVRPAAAAPAPAARPAPADDFQDDDIPF